MSGPYYDSTGHYAVDSLGDWHVASLEAELDRLRTRVRDLDATILRMKQRTAPLLTLLLAEFEYDGQETVTECAARILLEQRAEIERLRDGGER
jgi:hypothetical protein